MPIGLEDKLEGIIDLITMKAATFKGEKGEVVEWGEIPAALAQQCAEKRQEMIERLAEVDEAIGEKFIMEEPIAEGELVAGIHSQKCPL